MSSTYPTTRPLGFKVGSLATLVGASYVDNLFSASHNASNAIAICETWERRLNTLWGLQIKDGSKQYMQARGAEPLASPPPTWQGSQCMVTLGHSQQTDGGWNASWETFHTKAWKAFFAGAGHMRARNVQTSKRINSLNRSVSMLIRFYSPAWPPCATLRKRLDAMQHSMLAIIQRVPRLPDESDAQFARRRAKAMSQSATTMGRWSRLHITCSTNWHAHLERHQGDGHWLGFLHGWRDAEWLRSRRVSVGSASALAGRTSTRRSCGGISKRWGDGIALARSDLDIVPNCPCKRCSTCPEPR